MSRLRHNCHQLSQAAFTLLELMVVIAIIGLMSAIVAVRTGTFTYWDQEGAIRHLTETVSFLHYQAIADQSYYQLELNLTKNNLRVGVLKPDQESQAAFQSLAQDAGVLTLELAAFLNPSTGDSQTFIPPPSYPSLFEPYQLPQGMKFTSVRTMSDIIKPGDSTSTISGDDTRVLIRFSPRGFTDFAVIHLTLDSGAQVTVLINPFLGSTKVIREFKDFEWTYGRN